MAGMIQGEDISLVPSQ